MVGTEPHPCALTATAEADDDPPLAAGVPDEDDADGEPVLLVLPHAASASIATIGHSQTIG
jgi:hypothetical protein